MNTIADLHETIVAAGVPLDGVSKTGQLVDVQFKPEATAEQRQQAAAIVAAFDWSPPPPVKPRNLLAEIYLATDLETRTNVWNDFLGALILDYVNANPDAAQAILDARGIAVKIRGGG
jgi:hypothetical protein